MSEVRSHAPERNAAAFSTHINGSKPEFALGRSVVRWATLLYAAYLFLMPAYRHTFTVWMEFSAFYAVFLAVYFLSWELTGHGQIVAFAFSSLSPFSITRSTRELT